MNTAIKAAVESRGIPSVLHFTRLANLQSILTHGLVPREQFECHGISAVVNDCHRIDSCLGATSVSIGHPNYKMFWSLRQQDPSIEWVVLGVSASVLWTHECAFCAHNAASSEVTSIPLCDRMSADAFQAMFAEVDGKPSREEMGILSSWPTNPQAEILVFGRIEATDIGGVAFYNAARANEWRSACGNRQVSVLPRYFSARKDYMHWQPD